MPVLTMSGTEETTMLEHGQPSVLVEGLSLAFGGRKVLADVSLALHPGEVVLIRGENGSGKTTLLNVLSSHLRPDTGSVAYRVRGKTVLPARLSPEELAERGISRTWQDIRLFPTMTVLDNMLAADSWSRDSFFGDDDTHSSPSRWLAPISGTGLIGAAAIALGNMAPARLLGRAVFRRTRAKKNLVLARADWNLKLVGMDTRISSSCDKLSIGQMRRVALARALQKDPDILLLDEPLAGLDADNVKEVSMMLRKLASLHGKTVLVIEHRSAALDGVVDRVLFLNRGRLETE